MKKFLPTFMLLLCIGRSNAVEFTLTLSAMTYTYAQELVTLDLPEGIPGLRPGTVSLAPTQGGFELKGQIWRGRDGLKINIVLDHLTAGQIRSYRVRYTRLNSIKMTASRGKEGIDIRSGTHLITTYQNRQKANKPFFYPINGPAGLMTRHLVEEKAPGDTLDHPHHRGLWFTHGSVNGLDFWSETANASKTIASGEDDLFGGAMSAGFQAKTRWEALDGTLVMTDERQTVITKVSDDLTIMDFEIVLKPNGKPVTFGDTKEGTFGMRVPDALAHTHDKSGTCFNDTGLANGALWGKHAKWICYTGNVEDSLASIVMLSHASNLRYPETWHARDYGLFAVNPFGLHDFGMGDKGAGDFVLELGKTLRFRYRLIFGRRMTSDMAAHLSESYLHPPMASLKLFVPKSDK